MFQGRHNFQMELQKNMPEEIISFKRSHSKMRTILLLLGCLFIVAVLVATAGALGYHLRWSNTSGSSSRKVSPTINSSTTRPTPPTEDKAARLFDMIPIHYKLFLHPDLYSGNNTFIGKVTILMKAKNCIHSVKLNKRNISVINYSITVNDGFTTLQSREERGYDESGDVFSIPLKKSVCPSDGNFKVMMEYVGTLDQPEMDGFHIITVEGDGYTNKIASTQFSPKSARKAFPCLDDPLLKATFQITIKHRKNYQPLSNTGVESTLKVDDTDFLETTFRRTPYPMSTYLVGFALLTRYINRSAIIDNRKKTRITVHAPEEFANSLDLALSATQTILQQLNGYTNFSYSFPKLDEVAVPSHKFTAMENWGLITYRLPHLTYDRVWTSSGDQQRTVALMAHELAHKWFGNLVTMDWWSELWLKEGLSSYFEALGLQSVFGGSHVPKRLLARRTDALSFDANSYTHAIRTPTKTNQEIFDTITYSKGASILNMLADYMDEKNFQKGIRQYISKHQYGNADTDDLWHAMEVANPLKSDTSIKDLMANWTDNPGFPLITVNVTKDNSGCLIGLHQRRYYPWNENGKETVQQTWSVPITYITNENTTAQHHLLRTEHEEIQCSNLSWIMVNRDAKGFYRVNYDNTSWDALIRQLKENHLQFTIADRFAILDDALSLAQNNMLSYRRALELLLYLPKERTAEPLIQMTKSLMYMSEMLWHDFQVFQTWKQYVVKLFEPLSQSLTWNDINLDEDSNNRQILRSVLFPFLCWHGERKCLNETKHRFRRMSSETVSIDDPGWVSPNLLPTVLKYGQKNAEDSEFIRKKFEETRHLHTKAYYAGALGYAADARLLRKNLDMLLELSEANPRDAAPGFGSFVENPKIQAVVLDWLRNKVSKKNDTESGMRSLFLFAYRLAGKMNTLEDLSQMQEIIRRVPLATDTTIRSLEGRIVSNVQWTKTHKSEIVAWLLEQGYGKRLRPKETGN